MSSKEREFVLSHGDGPTGSVVVASPLERDFTTAEWLADTVAGIVGRRPAVIGPEVGAATAEPRIAIGTLSSSPALQAMLEEREVLLGLDTPFVRERLGDRRRTLPQDELQGHLDAWRSTHVRRKYLFPDDLREQDFIAFRATEDTLLLAGGSPQGTRYAAQALADRLYVEDGELIVDSLHTERFPILNQPAIPHRGIFTNIGGPDHLSHNQWEREWCVGGQPDYRAFIDWLVEHRVTRIDAMVFELGFGIAYPSERFPECVNRHHPNVKNEFMGDLIDYAHDNDIEVTAFISFPDMFAGVLRHHPELATKQFDPSKLPPDADWDEFQRTGANPNKHDFRKEFGTLCLSEPETRAFWESYLEELFTRYPGLDGITAQFAEDMGQVCTCDQCYARHFELHWQYFKRMAELVQRGRPDRVIYNCASPGDVRVLQHRDEVRNFVQVDWDVTTLTLDRGRSVLRGRWYLLHHVGEKWFELDWKANADRLSRLGVQGMLRRTVSFKDQESDHFAFDQFCWNPELSVEDFADLYVTRRLRRKDPTTTRLYCEWIKARDYAKNIRLLRELDGRPYTSRAIDQDYPRLLNEALDAVSSLLKKAERSALVDEIEEAFREQGEELSELAAPWAAHRRGREEAEAS